MRLRTGYIGSQTNAIKAAANKQMENGFYIIGKLLRTESFLIKQTAQQWFMWRQLLLLRTLQYKLILIAIQALWWENKQRLQEELKWQLLTAG